MAKLIIIGKTVFISALLAVWVGIPANEGYAPAMGDTTHSVMQQDTIIVTGRIFVGGHEPFTILALELEDGSAVVVSADDSLYAKLWSHQNKTLLCKGKYIPDELHGRVFHIMEFQKAK